MTAADDRAEQIRARLAALVKSSDTPLKEIDLAYEVDWLLAERDELLCRVEQAEARTREREQKAYETGQRDGAAAERHGREEEVKQAERAGAVKALRSVAVYAESFPQRRVSNLILTERADRIENGADL